MAITARATAITARPAYVAGPYDEGACYWQRQRFWDGYGWRIRNVQGLRLRPFTFIKSTMTFPETACFRECRRKLA